MPNKDMKTLDALLIALCLDYRRRADAIEKRSAQKRTDTEFRYLNFNIFEAAAEIVGEKYAEEYIKEIGERVGYAKSRVAFSSEAGYKNTKRLIKDNIAKKLHLI
jgi:uncharacterized metal-binding protein